MATASNPGATTHASILLHVWNGGAWYQVCTQPVRVGRAAAVDATVPFQVLVNQLCLHAWSLCVLIWLLAN